jgi:MFS family permease
MVGLERSVLPLKVAEGAGAPLAAVATLVIGFGATKAIFNLLVGPLADRFGRRRVLVAGWVVALPVPLLLAAAGEAAWPVVTANLLLGVNQALAWSMTLNMMIDLVPARRRGITAGLNEFAGYAGVSLLALLSGLLAGGGSWSGRVMWLGLGLAALGLLGALSLPETHESAAPSRHRWIGGIGLAGMLGAATNLKDGLVWLALPLLLAERGFTTAQIGLAAGLYPAVWAVGQLAFGELSDRIGRRALISGGVLIQGGGLLVLGLLPGLAWALVAAVIMGLGTSMAYPTLVAHVSAAVEGGQDSGRRATALGIYRFWRDGGYVLGSAILLSGMPLERTPLLAGTLLVALALIAWRRLA